MWVVRTSNWGRTRLHVVNESFPNAELHHKVVDIVEKKIRKDMPKDSWYMPESHDGMRHLDKVMEMFAFHYSGNLLQENTMSQADIGGRIATIASMVIPIAWRLITAFRVVDTEPMVNRILDKKIKKYTPDRTGTDVVTDYANLDPGENGQVAKTKTSYVNYPLLSTRQSLRSELTPASIATAYNTPMQPLIDAVENIALDVRQRIDLMLWWQHIVHGLRQSTQQVTTFETLTRVGTTNYMEFCSSRLDTLCVA